MKRHGFLLALLLVAVSCGSPSQTPDVASKGEPKKERRILYYDSAAVQSHSYLDRGKVEPYMSLIYDIQTHDDFLDASVRMVKGTQVDTYLWHIGNGGGAAVEYSNGSALGLFRFLRAGERHRHPGLP